MGAFTDFFDDLKSYLDIQISLPTHEIHVDQGFDLTIQFFNKCPSNYPITFYLKTAKVKRTPYAAPIKLGQELDFIDLCEDPRVYKKIEPHENCLDPIVVPMLATRAYSSKKPIPGGHRVEKIAILEIDFDYDLGAFKQLKINQNIELDIMPH